MADSLEEAWNDLNVQLEGRRILLDTSVAFHHSVEEVWYNLYVNQYSSISVIGWCVKQEMAKWPCGTTCWIRVLVRVTLTTCIRGFQNVVVEGQLFLVAGKYLHWISLKGNTSCLMVEPGRQILLSSQSVNLPVARPWIKLLLLLLRANHCWDWASHNYMYLGKLECYLGFNLIAILCATPVLGQSLWLFVDPWDVHSPSLWSRIVFRPILRIGKPCKLTSNLSPSPPSWVHSSIHYSGSMLSWKMTISLLQKVFWIESLTPLEITVELQTISLKLSTFRIFSSLVVGRLWVFPWNYINVHSNITDDELINCRFDLAFHYYRYLVSYYTTCVQHSSDEIAKWEFMSIHMYNHWKYDCTW